MNNQLSFQNGYGADNFRERKGVRDLRYNNEHVGFEVYLKAKVKAL